ncbi:MAG TPA: carboxypeptidase-like regulatory domain-containing protein [Anaerovoracaceae bacterium]|nr:carboxypeptidase-like regulatory domain-containing protein [Anaerovoracaceae bacterium]
MQNKIDSTLGKFRMLLVLPLIGFAFYSFALPEYNSPKQTFPSEFPGTQLVAGDVKGKVVNSKGEPLGGTSVIIKGTTTMAITDKDGNFKLKDVPKDGELVFINSDLQTVFMKPDMRKAMTVKMIPNADRKDKINPLSPQPIPPPIAGVQVKSDDLSNKTPLFFLNGTLINKAKMEAVKPNDIASLNVLNDKSAIDIFGDKAKDGVVLIFTR